MRRELRVDTDEVDDLARALRKVQSSLDIAQERADHLSESVGHAGLARAVRSFESDWKHRRAKTLEALDGLGDGADAIATSFADTDRELGNAVTVQE